MKFTPIYLGQSILKYEVPLDIFYAINNIYEHNIKKLVPANKQLIGKIKNEHSLFYNGINEAKVKRHNFLPLNIVKWFLKCYGHYLKFNNI